MRLVRHKRRDQSRFGAIDYALMAAGNCFAAYSAGMAMNEPDVAWFFVYTILGGSLFSLLVRRLFGETRFIQIDAYVYAGATIAAVLLTPNLNVILPGDGIPEDVYTAGWLCWMLCFGSALTWRDRTLLFQAVPTIALFGLVGCYDTYSAAPFMFFAFLLCLATLLGRAHSRDMLRQAVESGYFNRADAPNAPTDYPEQSPELYEDIKRGPWRWLAGPEWALLSGLVIVFVSVLGAPVIRFAVQPLAGVIKVNAPHRGFHRDAGAPSVSSYAGGYEVGRGPLFDQKAKPMPLFEARLDRIRYLRTATYDIYTGHSWRPSYPGSVPVTDDGPVPFAVHEMTQKRSYRISIQSLVHSSLLPLPIETVGATSTVDSVITRRQDGGGEAVQVQEGRIDINAVESLASPAKAERNLPDVMLPTLDASGVQPGVRSFADDAVKGQNTDFAKAQAIASRIGATCRYSLNASAVPPNQDAVDYFLNSSKVGYCDLFASAMTECARAEGLPARYVLGYLPDAQYTRQDGTTIIVDRDYHAWCEIFFKSVGWVVFDATAGATSSEGANSATVGATGASWLERVLNSLILLGVICLAAAGLLSALKKRASRRTVRTEIEKEFLTFAKALDRLGNRRRRPSETPDEYLAAVRPALNGSSESAEVINAKFVRALYAPVESPEALLQELKTEVKQFVNMSKKAKKHARTR